MEFFDGYSARQRSMNISALLDFSPLSKPQKNHLTKVYSLLLGGICITALGCYVQNSIFRLHVFVSLLAQLGCLLAVSMGSRQARQTGKMLSGSRMIYFGGFSFFMGTSIGDIVGLAATMDPGIPLQAFFGSIAIFACFSGAAMMAKQRSFLFLGSLLFSAMSYFTLASLFNMFFQSVFVHNVLLYGTLLAYMGFIIYDTQVTIEDFNRGNRDFVMHSVYLYSDLVAVFIRILIILMEKSDKDKRRRD